MTEFLKDIVEMRMSQQEVYDWRISMHSLDMPRFTSDPWEVAVYPTNEDLGTV
jgi:hypothetical protein